ncbi:Stk1 family PASTA domain-containing Ser/Thr kinase [Leucobacter weissii]|uniref:non-specific serine/threonine protein kinase n=1 Tax=Leucobacter weissii TaxID=1983706 RepID=A0A939S656_9MICO|nr:Stk1 family PASTA domain-containing Ser/Thr kinase [Leucobacter weissii]
MNSVPSDPFIGRTLDERYLVRSRIARGGMAMVYLGNDLRLQRRVAIKVMHQHLVEDENFTRRFEREARSAAMLGHANVVGVFDQGADGGVPYLVMEYLPGITLRELLKQQRRLTVDQTLEIGEAVLSGLAAAHAAGLVHRDVKPENVLLADDGRIKIGDFGLARAVSANTTTGQALLGTIAYLSPELVTRGIADERSDVYAFGIMTFEMLTGRQPFRGEQAMQIAYQHAHSDVPAPSSLAPETPPELDEFVRWCAERDPSLRPLDAAQALEALRAIRNGGGPGDTRILPRTGAIGTTTPSTTVLSGAEQGALQASTAPSAERPSSAPATAVDRARRAGARRARRGGWLAAALVVLIALAGGVGWWWGQGPGSQVTVPDVAGEELDAATLTLEELSLTVETDKCSSLEVEKGRAVGTEPAAGSRVDRESTVTLCRSTGPAKLDVPTLNGLPLEEAQRAIEEARFRVGEVVEERFDGGERGTVILALGSNGKGLGETYSEQGRIDLIVSAGSVPDVAGQTVEAATESLEAVGLSVDADANVEEHHGEVPEGSVIAMVDPGRELRVGDGVGVRISLGPELFEIPDVAELPLQEAIDTLEQAGFSPSSGVLETFRDFARATGTEPAAGERVPAGTEVVVRARVSLDF